MSDENGKTPQPKDRSAAAILLDVIVVAVVVAAAVGGTVWLWGAGAGRWADQHFLNVTTWTGAFVSLAGVLLAYLIFRRQAWQARKAARDSTEVLTELQALVARVDGKVDDVMDAMSSRVSDAEAEADSGTADRWSDVMPVEDETGLYLVSPSGKKRRLYNPGSVPLAVIGALVSVWRKEGRTGRWDIRSLRGAFRAEGKGNHPWYLVFVPPGREDPVLWKVTRGPNDTDAAVEITTGGKL